MKVIPTPYDYAVGIKRILKAQNITFEQLSEKIGRSVEFLKRMYKFIDLHPDLGEKMYDGSITLEMAEELIKYPKEEQLRRLPDGS